MRTGPMRPSPVVLSVWHSGTRTLREYLGGLPNQHFGYKPVPNVYRGEGAKIAHVPVRHPLDTAESWARRGKPVDALLSQYEYMAEYLNTNNPHLYKVEDLPRLAGTDDRDVVRDRTPAQVQEYKEIVSQRLTGALDELFESYYGKWWRI